MDLRFSDLSGLSNALEVGMVSPVELAQDFLQAMQQSPLGAVISLDPEVTLAQARAAQLRRDAGEAGPLLGIPVLHKDVFVTRDWPTTAGSRMLEGYRSPFDAEVVARLSSAGMVGLGKASCDEFAMGSANQFCAYGPALNPWDASRVPGGSSGGSAAAVAAGLAPAATGTDTGGSVRQPAAMCGITGIKPTYGRISRWGMVAYASSLDQAGPMARSARDCALLLNAMAGFDAKDSTSANRSVEDFAQGLEGWRPFEASESPLEGIRIGLPEEYFSDGLASGVRQAIEAAIDELRRLGAQTVEVHLPRTALSIPAYYVIAPAEASSNLSRFDGVRYGHRSSQAQDLQALYVNSRSEGFGAEVQRRILVGSFVLSHGYYDAYYLKAQQVRRLISLDFQQAFAQCDLLLGPVSPTVAWERPGASGQRAPQDPLQDYLADIYTLGASLAGLPAMSVPCGFATPQTGGPPMPVGLQLIGPAWQEARLLALAHAYQRQTDWHLQTPGSQDHASVQGEQR